MPGVWHGVAWAEGVRTGARRGEVLVRMSLRSAREGGSSRLFEVGSGVAPTTAWRARLGAARLDGGWLDLV